MLVWNLMSARKGKLAFWALSALLLYTLIGFLILPPIVRSIAVKQISQQLGREVSIAKVKVNPFALSATVNGLLIKDSDGEPFVSWEEVYVNFQISSLFSKAWTFKEISTTKPFVSVRLNQDGTFNFSDIIAKFATNTPADAPRKPAAPLVLHIDRLRIRRATAALADFTPREPFKRTVGPIDITLDHFDTDPENTNPYAFTGTTDAGERITWSGFFYLDPLRSQGSLTLDQLTLNKYAPLYQDLVRFEIRAGSIGVHLNYQFELSSTNRIAKVTDTAFALRDLKLGQPGDRNNFMELPHFAVTGANVDLQGHQASVGEILASGGVLWLKRSKNESINVVELSQPAPTADNVPGGILFLLHSVTNVVARLLASTNAWSGTVHAVNITNCALHFEDLVNSRPAKADLDGITLVAKNISNLPGTNFTADFSLRWNTNGTLKTQTTASFLPPTFDIQLDLDHLDLGSLDPYLEPKVNLLILGSKLGLHGKVSMRTPPHELPAVAFHGDVSLDDFKTVDGVAADDLLKWDGLHFNGIDANLNPPTVAIKEMVVNNAFARVIIETNRSINLITALHPANPAVAVETKIPAVVIQSAGPTTNAVAVAAVPQISIGTIVLSNATIHFTDRSMTPNVNLTIGKTDGTIAGISTEQLQHADINLHALIDNVGPADITGHINPFSGTQTNEIKISVKDVDLTPTSPYAGKFAGYRIARGKLNLDLAYNLVGKNLSSKNVITLDQFTFGEKVDSPDATHLPVRLAVAILKDRDGKIILDVPIEGSTDDPKFRIGKVVVRVLENILVKVATSPFSLLGAAFGGGGEELSYQEFAPGSAELSPDNVKKLDSLVKGLAERPALQLEISGSIDPPNDREGLQRATLDRQMRTKKWLSLRKSESATNTVDQVTLTPEERRSFVQKIYAEALASGKITPAIIAANTNLAILAAKVPRRSSEAQKGAMLLGKQAKATASKAAVVLATTVKMAAPADPMETLLAAMVPVTDSDLAALAANRAKVVQAYLIQTGKMDASRLFLTEGQTGGARADGSRAFLQFR